MSRGLLIYRFLYFDFTIEHGPFTIWSSTSQFCLFLGSRSRLDGWLKNHIHPGVECRNQILPVTALNAQPCYKRAMQLKQKKEWTTKTKLSPFASHTIFVPQLDPYCDLFFFCFEFKISSKCKMKIWKFHGIAYKPFRN